MATKLAKSIVLNLKDGTVTIDGEIFDWHVARETVDITTGVDEMTIVRLPILTDHLEIIPNIEDDEEFCPECLAGTESAEHLTSPCGENDR